MSRAPPSAVVALLVILAIPLAGCTRPAEDPWHPTEAQALLWDMFYLDVVVEVDHVAGRELPPSVVAAAIAEMAELTGRSIRLGSVREIPGLVGDAGREWSTEELAGVMRSTLDDPESWYTFGTGTSAVLHVISLDGRTGAGSHPLGTSAYHTAIVFLDQLAELQPAGRAHPNFELDVQQTLTHEMGHTVGLVGCGVPMVRKHDDGSCHSSQPTSVMYVPHGRYDSTFELAQPGTQRLRFDADDRADIAAYIELGKRCAVDHGCGADRAATRRPNDA